MYTEIHAVFAPAVFRAIMALLCCIGGVCIPDTALLPLLVLGWQGLLQPLSAAGLFAD
jgi:hypothetical protein